MEVLDERKTIIETSAEKLIYVFAKFKFVEGSAPFKQLMSGKRIVAHETFNFSNGVGGWNIPTTWGKLIWVAIDHFLQIDIEFYTNNYMVDA